MQQMLSRHHQTGANAAQHCRQLPSAISIRKLLPGQAHPAKTILKIRPVSLYIFKII